MGRRGSTDQRLTAEQVAAHAEQAVAEKVDRKDTSLALRQAKVMVLDALDLPGFTASGVVDVLRSSPSATLSGYKYQAIWLVGPTVELVYRLDVPEND
jgi:hypothetical protein